MHSPVILDKSLRYEKLLGIQHGAVCKDWGGGSGLLLTDPEETGSLPENGRHSAAPRYCDRGAVSHCPGTWLQTQHIIRAWSAGSHMAQGGPGLQHLTHVGLPGNLKPHGRG